MVAPVPTAEVLLISRHPRRSLDLRRLGLEVRQEDPATLSEAPVIGAAGIVIIDALDGDTAAAELLASVGPHVESAAVVVLLDETTPPPEALGAQMRILRSPIRGQDVATTIHELFEAPMTAEPQPTESSPVAPPAFTPPVPPPAPSPTTAPTPPIALPVPPQPTSHPEPVPRPTEAAAPSVGPLQTTPPAPPPAEPPAPAQPPAPAPEAPPASAPARRVPPPRERRFGRRRHSSDDEVPVESSRVQQAQPVDWSAHAEAILAGLHARPSWREVAQAVAEDAAPVLGPSAALLVREPDGTWPVAAGVDLRQIEFGLVVDDEHTLIGLGTKQHPVAVVPDTDVLRSDLIGAPLASRRSLLVALVFPLPVLLVVGRTEAPFDKDDVKTAVGLVERWRWPLASALQRRDLARALQRFA